MKSCCCCGVRGGTIASAIYSMIFASLGLAIFIFSLMNVDDKKHDFEEYKREGLLGHLDVVAYYYAVLTECAFAIVFLAFVFFSSIIVLVGIRYDNKIVLIPFIVSKFVGFIWYIYVLGLSVYEVAAIGTDYAGEVEVIALVILVPFFIGDVVCILCVWSQYKEYGAGRGRICDQIPLQHRTMIVHQHMPGAATGFGFKQMDDAPPAYKPTRNDCPI